MSTVFPDTEVDKEIAGVFNEQPSTQLGTPVPELGGRQAAAVQAMQSY